MKMKLPIVRAASFEVWSVMRFLGMKGETPSSIHAEITLEGNLEEKIWRDFRRF